MGILEDATYICDSETGHCILGPFHGVYDVCFSPAGKHILLQYGSCAVAWDIEMGEEQFQIEGSNFAFVHHDGRIASMKKNRNSDDFEDKDTNRILVQFWDAGNGKLISSRTLEVNDVFDARFSPDGYFLVIQKKSENVIELWNLEDNKDFQQFTYSYGGFEFLCFFLTSDTLIVETNSDFTHQTIYLWRLDTQEMVSFSCDRSSSWSSPHVIHSPLTSYLFLQ